MFLGFDEKGTPLYDTRDAAIERAKQIRQYGDDPDAQILICREQVPYWLRYLVRNTRLEWIGYKPLQEKA